MGRLLQLGVVILVVLVLQVELVSDTRIFGVMPELLLGATIAAAWAAGPERGAGVGFVCGLLYDLYLPTPLALSAITYVIIGFGVGVASATVAVSGERLIRRVVSTLGVAAGITLFVILGELLGQSNLYTDRFFKILVIATFYTALFMPLLHRAMQWAFGVHDVTARPPQRLTVVE